MKKHASNIDSTMKIQESFDKTLEETQLSEVVYDIAEIPIDHLMDMPLIKDVPIIKTFAALLQTGVNIRDRLFLKKILSFLANLENIDVVERGKMIQTINESKKYRLKVGEKLLYIIDRCNDFESSELIAKLFAAFIKENITYEDYLIASEAVSSNSVDDIRWFLKEYSDTVNVDDIYVPLHTGLFNISTEPVQVNVETEDDTKALLDGANPFRTSVSGGGVWAEPSRAGKIIYRVLHAV